MERKKLIEKLKILRKIKILEKFKVLEDLKIPEIITLTQNGPDTTITLRWFKIFYIYLFIFSVSWLFLMGVLSFFIFYYGNEIHILLEITLSLFLALGMISLYISLVGIFNKTLVILNEEKIIVTHRPLPHFRKYYNLIPTNIIKIHTERKIKFKRYIYYNVYFTTRDQKLRKLLGYIEGKKNILYIERKLKELLKLQ